MLRDTDTMLLPAVKASVAALKDRTEADDALVRLAEQYAAEIDATPEDKQYYALRYLGPLLHDALESLGATPVARTRTRGKEGTPAGGTSRLAALRAAHPAS
jgi:hypothetical protein